MAANENLSVGPLIGLLCLQLSVSGREKPCRLDQAEHSPYLISNLVTRAKEHALSSMRTSALLTGPSALYPPCKDFPGVACGMLIPGANITRLSITGRLS